MRSLRRVHALGVLAAAGLLVLLAIAVSIRVELLVICIRTGDPVPRSAVASTLVSSS